MSGLSDDELEQIYYAEARVFPNSLDGLRAVADAAIAADRAARAEPVAYRLSYEFMGKNREILTESVVVADAIKECRPCVIDPLYTAPPAAPVVPEEVRERAERWIVAWKDDSVSNKLVMCNRAGKIIEELLLAAAPVSNTKE